MASPDHMPAKLWASALLSLAAVLAGTLLYLSEDLPEHVGEARHYPVEAFRFAFGSGIPVGGHMRVDQFANGYALLSSGPVRIQADAQRMLTYSWKPSGPPREAAFFWRRSDDPQNVQKTEITVVGTHSVDLSSEPEWKGEVTEIGFLLAGESGDIVEIGDVILLPDSVSTRIKLTWRAWVAFEEWSQQSINFLYGGDYRQVVALPLLMLSWLLLTLFLLWVFTRFGHRTDTQRLLLTAGLVFLLAWVVLDSRWAINNIRQLRLSLQSGLHLDSDQRASIDLDGELFQYVQRLKNEVLGKQAARILILGDETAIDYYLLRAKYHLLPHSADVAAHISRTLTPQAIDYVVFFGQPGNITRVRGWDSNWKNSLTAVDQSKWGQVYKTD